MGREGFEPSKAEPTDLQSVPFGHSGTSPNKMEDGLKNSPATRRQYLKNSHPQEAQHPQGYPFKHASLGGAGKGTRTPDLLITNQLLYQLSYASPANEKRP